MGLCGNVAFPDNVAGDLLCRESAREHPCGQCWVGSRSRQGIKMLSRGEATQQAALAGWSGGVEEGNRGEDVGPAAATPHRGLSPCSRVPVLL